IGPNGLRCESEMQLAAGKITTVQCILPEPATPPATGSGSAVNASTPPPATGSSTPPVANADKDKAAADKAAADKAAADKAAADKAAADKVASADKAAADKAAKDKAAADKAAADKAARDKAAADKISSTKPKDSSSKPRDKDKMPVEENPIDKAASLPSKGYVKIVAPKDAQTLIDGAAPSGSLSKLPLSPGKHKVQFIIGSDKHSFSVMVKAGETVTL